MDLTGTLKVKANVSLGLSPALLLLGPTHHHFLPHVEGHRIVFYSFWESSYFFFPPHVAG